MIHDPYAQVLNSIWHDHNFILHFPFNSISKHEFFIIFLPWQKNIRRSQRNHYSNDEWERKLKKFIICTKTKWNFNAVLQKCHAYVQECLHKWECPRKVIKREFAKAYLIDEWIWWKNPWGLVEYPYDSLMCSIVIKYILDIFL